MTIISRAMDKGKAGGSGSAKGNAGGGAAAPEAFSASSYRGGAVRKGRRPPRAEAPQTQPTPKSGSAKIWIVGAMVCSALAASAAGFWIMPSRPMASDAPGTPSVSPIERTAPTTQARAPVSPRSQLVSAPTVRAPQKTSEPSPELQADPPSEPASAPEPEPTPIPIVVSVVVKPQPSAAAPSLARPKAPPVKPATQVKKAAAAEDTDVSAGARNRDVAVAEAPPARNEEISESVIIEDPASPQPSSVESVKTAAAMEIEAPTVEPAPTIQPATDTSWRDFKLSGVFWSETDPGAIINGRIVSEGKRLGDMTVKKIHKTHVTIEIAGKAYDLRY